MPLYKLFCIAAHYPEYSHIKNLVYANAKFLLDQGSAVRDIRYLGMKSLPQRMRRHKNNHTVGDYWLMHFDAPPRVLDELNQRMRMDHRVIRWTMLKLGERLTDIADMRQSTVSYSAGSIAQSDDETWSEGATGLPSGFVNDGASLPGMPPAAFGGDDMVESLGGKGYARDRI